MAGKPLERSPLLLTIVVLALGAPFALLSTIAFAAPGGGDDLRMDDDDDDKKDDKDGDDKKDDEDGDDKVDPTIREAITEILTSGVKHKLKNGNKIEIEYPLEGGEELADWESKGFDKIMIRHVDSYHGSSSGPGLEIGAGSRRAGFAQHQLPLTGDFTIELEFWMAHTAPSSIVAFMLSKKVGVLWGQAICKKSMKPYNKRARWDLNQFGAEKKSKFKFVAKGGELTVHMNGRKMDVRQFKKGELDQIQLGITAKNARVVITDLKIKGEVDPSKL